MHSARPFPVPERARRADGEMRRLGVEIEFGGLLGKAIVDALIRALGGTAAALSVAKWRLDDTSIVALRIELDSRFVQRVARDVNMAAVPSWLAEITEWISDVLERFVSLAPRHRCGINAIHRQAVSRIGAGLGVVAMNPDGIPQAVEYADAAFVIGVQWHPEYLARQPLQRRLFHRLQQAALGRDPLA